MKLAALGAVPEGASGKSLLVPSRTDRWPHNPHLRHSPPPIVSKPENSRPSPSSFSGRSRFPDPVRAIGKLNWDVDTTINDLTQSAVVRVIATHSYDEIMAGIRDESLTKTLTKATRRELRQFGVHVTRCKLVDFADCKVFKLLTSQADHQGMATHQFYQ